MNGTERIEFLRQSYLEKPYTGFTSDEMSYLYAKGWQENRSTVIIRSRRAKALQYMFDNMTPCIGRYELIVGKPNFSVKLTEEQRQFRDTAYSFMNNTVGQWAHMALDYEKLLDKGTSGVAEEIRGYMAKLDVLNNPNDIEKKVFYEDCLRMLEALENVAARYAQCAREMSAAAETQQEKLELLSIASNLEVVPKYPAKTFWQALQSVQMLLFPLEGLYQQGRPDQYLLKYYQNDVANGTLTKEFAQELIDCSCIMFNEYNSKGLAVGLMVGGRYPDGSDVVNDLTYMYIRSIRHTRLSYPGIGLCVTPRTPDDLLTLAVDALAHGCTHPALFNDEVIVRGLMYYGLPFEEAVSYTHSTCVEITPIKRSGVWVASPYHNLVEPLLRIMGVYKPEELRNAATFDELLEEYKQVLGKMIDDAVVDQNTQQIERKLIHTNPLTSCFVDDCLAKGCDIDQNGAKYMFIESSFVGMSNLVDSLMAIKKLVFEQKKLTIGEYGNILRDDFKGNEALRMYILNKLPKYGNGNPEADSLFKSMTEWITDRMQRYTTIHNSRFVPSMFCWIMHERMGSGTPASPDGRESGFPLGDGSGPAQGRESEGPTTSILSSTCWEHEKFIGGIAVNLKFTRSTMSEKSYDRILTLIRTYMERGGFELQINCVNREELLDAQIHPELHKDLVVRIGGYSDYFTALSKGMQNEVLLRTAHDI